MKGELRAENPGMAEPSSEGAPPLLNSHTQKQLKAVLLWQPNIHTAHTGQHRMPQHPATSAHTQKGPSTNVHSWFVHGYSWDWAGKGCHAANQQRPPVLAKFTASQGPSVLHHQPVLCRMLEVLAQHRTWLPQTGPQSLDFPLLHPRHTGEMKARPGCV